MNISNTNPSSITLCVIGHTNVGKTSLMRTLSRNQDFGEVKNASATTRHVEASVITHGEHTLTLLDTPGLEDASGVMDYLVEHTNPRSDGVDRLQEFLNAIEQKKPPTQNYTQEAKVIKALMSSDIALYVIDSREPVLSKYQDELAIVAWSGTPVLPVFNFIRDTHNIDTWRQMLTKRALHVVSLFDTVAYDFDNEIKLWQNLSTLTGATHIETKLQSLIAHRQDSWQGLLEDGQEIIADFLVNIAAFSKKIDEDDDISKHLEPLHQQLRQLERQTQDKLLALYRFYNHPIQDSPLTVTANTTDPFDINQLALYGIKSIKTGTAGAIIGAGIDVAALGTTLGLGTLIGGVIGGALGNADAIKDKAMGKKSLTLDDATLLVFASRLCQLHATLRHLGHANLNTIHTQSHQLTAWQDNKLPKALKQARQHSNYSDIGTTHQNQATIRQHLVVELAHTLPPSK